MQKAGFLYLEESFSKDDKVFRRRVVLAVSCCNKCSMTCAVSKGVANYFYDGLFM